MIYFGQKNKAQNKTGRKIFYRKFKKMRLVIKK